MIIVWDKEGKYFQNWVGKNSKSPSIKHGINIAKLIKGTQQMARFKTMKQYKLLHTPIYFNETTFTKEELDSFGFNTNDNDRTIFSLVVDKHTIIPKIGDIIDIGDCENDNIYDQDLFDKANFPTKFVIEQREIQYQIYKENGRNYCRIVFHIKPWLYDPSANKHLI